MPGPLRSMNLPTRSRGRQRLDQLDVAVADLEQNGLDALLLDGLAVLLAPCSKPSRVELDRGVEVLDGDADVVDAPEHGRGV